jgi:hypothetical protein
MGSLFSSSGNSSVGTSARDKNTAEHPTALIRVKHRPTTLSSAIEADLEEAGIAPHKK